MTNAPAWRNMVTCIRRTSSKSARNWPSSGTMAGESFIPLESLRRHCPCAGCQGEPDIMGQSPQRPRRTAHAAILPTDAHGQRRRLRHPARLGRRPRHRNFFLRLFAPIGGSVNGGCGILQSATCRAEARRRRVRNSPTPSRRTSQNHLCPASQTRSPRLPVWAPRPPASR
jgi:hypothetical protein